MTSFHPPADLGDDTSGHSSNRDPSAFVRVVGSSFAIPRGVSLSYDAKGGDRVFPDRDPRFNLHCLSLGLPPFHERQHEGGAGK